MEKNSIKQLLMSNGFYVLNKKIVKIFGIESAFMLTTLVESSDSLADDDGWFYKTAPALEEETGLSGHKQSKILEVFLLLGILEQENKGMPMKRYFKINYQKIEDLVLNNLIPCIEEIQNQAFKKFKGLDLKNLIPCIQKISNNIITNNKKLINKELNNKKLNIENIEAKLQEEEEEKSEKDFELSNNILRQEIRMLIGTKKIDVEDIIRLNKSLERIKFVFDYCERHKKDEGYIIGALKGDWNLKEYQPDTKTQSKRINHQRQKINYDDDIAMNWGK